MSEYFKLWFARGLADVAWVAILTVSILLIALVYIIFEVEVHPRLRKAKKRRLLK
jgi:hypothetical protein